MPRPWWRHVAHGGVPAEAVDLLRREFGRDADARGETLKALRRRVGRKEVGRQALRRLEAEGEYWGFTRPPAGDG